MKTVATNYVTTPEKIRSLTQSILQATGAVTGGRETYFKSLVATTQKELGAPMRERTGKGATLDAAEIQTQLTALMKVHDAFYEVVLEVCAEDLPPGKGRAVELNRRSNFARTAHSSVRSWIRAGKDITAVAAARVTKASLAVTLTGPRREISMRIIAKRMDKRITELITMATEIATVDREGAAQQLEIALSKIAARLTSFGNGHTATTSPAKAIAERRPLKTRTGLFFPTVPVEMAPEALSS